MDARRLRLLPDMFHRAARAGERKTVGELCTLLGRTNRDIWPEQQGWRRQAMHRGREDGLKKIHTSNR
ncbi:MAG: hypothetical protein RQ833_02580 [Sphingomonadaceae bacterium]|nr:hypothetical protein [Sphingomonadaceae bacterium]